MRFPRVLVIGYLIVSLLLLSFPPEAAAIFLPSTVPAEAAPDRSQDLARIRSLLESRVVQQRLSDLGLSPTQIQERLAGLSDGQIHQLATRIDGLMAGGDALGVVVLLLVIAILVVLLLQMTGHRVIITK